LVAKEELPHWKRLVGGSTLCNEVHRDTAEGAGKERIIVIKPCSKREAQPAHLARVATDDGLCPNAFAGLKVEHFRNLGVLQRQGHPIPPAPQNKSIKESGRSTCTPSIHQNAIQALPRHPLTLLLYVHTVNHERAFGRLA
jgi:hypothetical protein